MKRNDGKTTGSKEFWNSRFLNPKDVQSTFESLEESSGKIFSSLQEFEANTKEIAVGSDVQDQRGGK